MPGIVNHNPGHGVIVGFGDIPRPVCCLVIFSQLLQCLGVYVTENPSIHGNSTGYEIRVKFFSE
jgi:hypothetical protein